MIKFWHIFVIAFLLFFVAAVARAATTNDLGTLVQISDDGMTTIPANTIATPGQVNQAQADATAASEAAALAAESAAQCRATVEQLQSRVSLYRTNYLIKSVAYCEGVGGVSFDPSNQVIRIYYFDVAATSLVIRGVAKINPLGSAIPRLEFRATLASSQTWTNMAIYSAAEIAVPAEFSADYEKAYQYIVARPAGTALFARMVDGSSGISGSGWYWLVYGDIVISRNGAYYKGRTGLTTNIVGTVTNVLRYASGLNVELEPLGGL